MTTRIYERDGATKTRIDVTHNADGSVTISGYDWGEAPSKAYGRDELDYELRIPPHAVRGAVTALLRALLANSETPMTTLRAVLEGEQVDHKFQTLP